MRLYKVTPIRKSNGYFCGKCGNHHYEFGKIGQKHLDFKLPVVKEKK